MGYQAYLNMGGAPRGDPKFDASAVFDPLPSKTMPYLVLTSILGAFMLCQLRKVIIIHISGVCTPACALKYANPFGARGHVVIVNSF